MSIDIKHRITDQATIYASSVGQNDNDLVKRAFFNGAIWADRILFDHFQSVMKSQEKLIEDLRRQINEKRDDSQLKQVSVYSGADLKNIIRNCLHDALTAHELANKKKSNEKPIRVKDVCILTGYSESSVRTKVMNHEIPFHKRGARVFFFEDEILDWIKEGNKVSFN